MGHEGKSSVADHAMNENHRIDWDGVEVVGYEQNWYKRKVKERLLIDKHSNNMNSHPGIKLCKGWNSLKNTPSIGLSQATLHPHNQGNQGRINQSDLHIQFSQPDDGDQ